MFTTGTMRSSSSSSSGVSSSDDSASRSNQPLLSPSASSMSTSAVDRTLEETAGSKEAKPTLSEAEIREQTGELYSKIFKDPERDILIDGILHEWPKEVADIVTDYDCEEPIPIPHAEALTIVKNSQKTCKQKDYGLVVEALLKGIYGDTMYTLLADLSEASGDDKPMEIFQNLPMFPCRYMQKSTFYVVLLSAHISPRRRSFQSFQEANLQETCLLWADFQKRNFQEANLKAADLRRANLKGTDMEKADLRGIKSQGARVERTNFTGTIFEGKEAYFPYCTGNPNTTFLNLLRHIYLEPRLFSWRSYRSEVRQFFGSLSSDDSTRLSLIKLMQNLFAALPTTKGSPSAIEWSRSGFTLYSICAFCLRYDFTFEKDPDSKLAELLMSPPSVSSSAFFGSGSSLTLVGSILDLVSIPVSTDPQQVAPDSIQAPSANTSTSSQVAASSDSSSSSSSSHESGESPIDSGSAPSINATNSTGPQAPAFFGSGSSLTLVGSILDLDSIFASPSTDPQAFASSSSASSSSVSYLSSYNIW